MLGPGAYPHAAWNLYNLALASHPIFTKCMTSLTCFILSDTVAQLPSGKVPYPRSSQRLHVCRNAEALSDISCCCFLTLCMSAV